jgi:hypothetical protein
MTKLSDLFSVPFWNRLLSGIVSSEIIPYAARLLIPENKLQSIKTKKVTLDTQMRVQ